MGLLNKKSLYDIVPGPNAPVGDAGTFLPETFDNQLFTHQMKSDF